MENLQGQMESPLNFINLIMNTLKSIYYNFTTQYFMETKNSMNQAIITLLPKNDKKENLKN